MLKTIFNWLKGTWDFQRNIPEGLAIGTATFRETAQSNALHYHETGRVILNNKKSVFHNSYLYVLDCSSALFIYFLEQEKTGRLFHVLTFDENKASGKHLCNLDHYYSQYEFNFAEQSFELRTEVKGPKKEWAIVTKFKKNC